MRLVIYNASSFGGIFEYSLKIHEAYLKDKRVESCILLLPANSSIIQAQTERIFLPDLSRWNNVFLRKFSFLKRTLINPFILLFRLRKEASAHVILNDFDQLFAWLWVPFYKMLLGKKHSFSIILHDPDRDAFPPNIWFSGFCMRQILSMVDVAFYHEFLPEKSYYQANGRTMYVSVPHGIYPKTEPQEMLLEFIQNQKPEGFRIMSIIGKIRQEKNYELAIQALTQFPDLILMIAGKPSSAAVNVDAYKKLAKVVQVENRILWFEKYLSPAEMASVIESSDLILLNYSRSFTSQSGILNMIAGFKKRVIASNGNSSLSHIMKEFQLGVLVEPDDQKDLERGIEEVFKQADNSQNWDRFLHYASWENHVDMVLNCFQQKSTE